MDGPSAVYLSHTSNAAEANGVAELGAKPDVGETFTENRVVPQKTCWSGLDHDGV